jgi:MurNAc alpha-1-phosphate uridylyltransferase
VSLLPVAILAGGLATRLRGLTCTIPKSLLNIAGRPFIFHQLELLQRQGVERVVLCVGHLGEQVQAAVGDGRQFDLTIDYSFDGDALLGTGGALKQALSLCGDQFFVLYGDAYLPCSFACIQSAYEARECAALLTVMRNDNRWDRSNVLFKDGELIAYDKRSPRNDMEHIDYGVSILSAAVFAEYADVDCFDLADVYQRLALQGQLAGWEIHQRFYEIGSYQGIQDTEAFLQTTRNP